MATNTLTDAPATTAALYRAIRTGSDGATVDSYRQPLPETGYWVGGQSWTLVKAVSRITPDDVAGFVSTHPNARYFGVWVENGRAYLDVVDHVPAERSAYALATARSEMAVFNIATGESEWL
ncbi:hypothetical protein BJP40_06640 [Streptomyces sp. CC53]|uniref:hypothetical protein n=1 Tax=Streptomyces sp. CC53 TaxID=1906740 RepID=UPI0008DD328E|nr:hypothetical protein [Streptomyces sp. CC53]OII61199.1 hypothetical protein BJP40_06640 [Streptomyces sp. CC53]